MKAGIRLGLCALCVLGALITGISRAAVAQQGTVTGRVTDRATGDPLENARIILPGPNRVEATGRDGRFTFRGVPAGTQLVMIFDLHHRIRVAGPIRSRIGMAAKDETTSRRHEQREAQDERELNLIPAETISTP
jgi:hypothetical protein